MDGVLTGTDAGTTQPNALKVKSVLLTATSGGFASLILSHYNLATGTWSLTLKAATDGTAQFSFKGLPFPSGLKVDVDGDIACYLIEYERENP